MRLDLGSTLVEAGGSQVQCFGRNGPKGKEIQFFRMWRLWAAAAAWRRLVTPSLRRMLDTCTLAVFSLM